ncbi:MAG: hypothetical protein AABX73_02600 [Nanoarchaeota archaeon]
MKNLIKRTFITGIIGLNSCTYFPAPVPQALLTASDIINLEQQLNCDCLNEGNEREPSYFEEMLLKDGEAEPVLEKELEQQYGINITGNSENPEPLRELESSLSLFRKPQLEGLTIILNSKDSFDPRENGYYYQRTAIGKVALIGHPISIVAPHELGHHVHINHPQREDFDREWKSVLTKISIDGLSMDVTTEEATKLIKRRDMHTWDLQQDLAHISKAGAFGFVRPYSRGTDEQAENGINKEDVATFFELIQNSFDCNRPDIQIAYWYKDFSLEPYIKKLEIISNYGLLDIEIIDKKIEELNNNTEIFSSFRDGSYQMSIEEHLRSIQDPNVLDKENVSQGVNYYLSPDVKLGVRYLLDQNGDLRYMRTNFILGYPYGNCLEQDNIPLIIDYDEYRGLSGESIINSPFLSPPDKKKLENIFTEKMTSLPWQNELEIVANFYSDFDR